MSVCCVEEAEGPMTGRAGLVVVAEAFRALEGFAACEEGSVLKRRKRGLSEAEMVESFLLLLTGGGDCVDDFEALREDVDLSAMVGHGFPSPTAAWEFFGWRVGRWGEARCFRKVGWRVVLGSRRWLW